MTTRHAIPRNAVSGAKGHAKTNDMQNGHAPMQGNGPKGFPTKLGLPSHTVTTLCVELFTFERKFEGKSTYFDKSVRLMYYVPIQ